MAKLARALECAGYAADNVDYPSRAASIAGLAESAIPAAVGRCVAAGATAIHFVTHSLGGILVRRFLARHTLPQLGRVVMLGPPNQGSEVVDRLGGLRVFAWLNGPAGRELGTRADSTPNALGPAVFPVGIIAGNRSVNWINSLLIPGPDDGKVSVTRTKLAGMTGHIVIRATHPFMMRNAAVIRQTLAFLRTGQFEPGNRA